MKKVLFILIALCMCHAVFSQEIKKVENKRKSEIKLNLVTLFWIIPEISYEYILNEKMGIGLSAGPAVQWGKNQHYIDDAFHLQVTPYYRYFLYKALYIEANTALARFEYNTKLGFGYALGCKFVNKNGFLADFFIGRGHFDSWNGGYLRIGLSVGKQF